MPKAKLWLVGVAEVARMGGVSKQAVGHWRQRYVRDTPRVRAMPKPVAELAAGPIWLGAEIEAWLANKDYNRA